MSDKVIEIDGVRYWQPECHCKGTGHICYLRPMPSVIEGIDLAKLSGASGNMPLKSAQSDLTKGSSKT